MKVISNKYLRLVVLDPNVRVGLIGLMIGLVILAIELKMVNQANAQLKQAMQDSDLVKRIPEMERKLRVSARRGMTSAEYRFEGITISDGISYAVINGAIYKIGDLVGDDTVKDIQKGTVVLENQETKEIKNLYLPSWEKE